MIKKHPLLFSKIFRLSEILTIIISFMMGFWIYEILRGLPLISIKAIFKTYSVELLLYLFIWIYISSEWGMYSSKRITPILNEIKTLFKASFISFVPVLIVNLILRVRIHQFHQLIYFLCLNIFFLTIFRICLRKTLRFIRSKGFNFRNVIIVGKNRRSKELVKKIQEQEQFGLNVIGYVDESMSINYQVDFPESVRYFGNLNELKVILNNNIVDEVFVALPIKSFYTKIEDIIDTCASRGIGVKIVTDMFFLRQTRNSLDRIDNIPLLNISPGPDDIFQIFMKRCVDIGLATILLALFSPVFLIISLLVKMDSPGSLLYIQERVGCNNRRFKLFKFRTMIMNAETMKSKLLHLNELEGPVFKISDDPRITRIGRMLRRFSIDELPQLINVLKGDMSLVGPRPPLSEEVKAYSWEQRRRLCVKPGITGLWQVSGRNIIPFEQWVRLDLEYIDNWTLGMDFKILLKTLYAVLSRKGAM